MSSTYNARTYGRRKRKQTMEGPSEPRKKLKQSDEEQLTDMEDHTRSPTPELSPSPLRTYGTPARPAPVAKDLSGIFQSFTPTSSQHATPTKLARRMLGRSKTDSSIDSTPRHDVDRTSSLPALFSSPSSPSSKPGPSTRTREHEPRPPPIALPNTTRTYAGTSRSFLVAIPTASLDPLAADDEDEYSARESYASLRSRWGVDNSEDDPFPHPSPGKRSPSRSDATATPTGTPSRMGRGKAKQQQPPAVLPNGMMNPLKSITELRSKGESRRFLDEVGYLFEGMHASVGIGLRRASALEITTKLCDADFSRKAKAADFISRAWDVFGEAGAGRGEDKILDTLLALFTALISRDPSAVRDLAQRPPPTSLATSPVASASASSSKKSQSKSSSKQTQVLSPPPNSQSLADTLFALLAAPADPLAVVAAIESASPKSKDLDKHEAELKKMGVGKKERVMFQTIHTTIISKSFLFPPATQISTPLLLLHALHALPPALIPPRHLPILLRSLKSTLACLLPLDLSLLVSAPAPISRTSSASRKSTPLKTKGTSAMQRTTSTSSTSTSSAYLSWPDHAPIFPYQTAFLHLCLLDAYLLAQWGREASSSSSSSNNPGPGVDPDALPNPGGTMRENNGSMVELEEVNEEAMGPWLAEGLVALAVCAELASVASSSYPSSSEFTGRRGKKGNNSEKRSLEMALRVLVSLTHADAELARRVAENECAVAFLLRVVGRVGSGAGGGVKEEDGREEPEDIKAEMVWEEEAGSDVEADEKDHSDTTDTLCLALGLLTNLIQGVPGFHDILRDTRLDSTCTLKKRTCIRRCTCAPTPTNGKGKGEGKGKARSATSTALDVLVQVYNLYQAPPTSSTSPPPTLPASGLGASADADALFLRGHLAVVFGLLIRGSTENEEYLLRALASDAGGEDDNREREVVGRLADQAREFVAFYTALGGGGGVGAGAAGGGGGGEPVEDMRVARDVIRFLEARRQ